MTTMHNQEDTVTRSRHKSVKRQRVTSCFMHHGYSVRMATFGFLYGVGEGKLKTIKKRFLIKTLKGFHLRQHLGRIM